MISLEALLAAAQSGDVRDRDALADALYAMLFSFFGRRCWHPQLEAEDLVQTTMLVLLRRIDSFVPEHPQAFKYFVYHTARSVLHGKRRSVIREGDRRVFETPEMIATNTSPSARVSRREQLELIAKLIAELDSIDQRLIAGSLRGTDWRDLAEREGGPLGDVAEPTSAGAHSGPRGGGSSKSCVLPRTRHPEPHLTGPVQKIESTGQKNRVDLQQIGLSLPSR